MDPGIDSGRRLRLSVNQEKCGFVCFIAKAITFESLPILDHHKTIKAHLERQK